MKNRDLSDFLSPILVKELRQGLRARIFTTSFLLLQGMIMVSMTFGLFTVGVGGDPYEKEMFQFFFWSMVSIPVLFLMPLSAFGAIRSEQQKKTLELVFLTRLSAFRIVTGKWIAVVVQTILIAVAVLPYVVLRYFLGGIELWQDLAVLGMLLVGSAVLSAVAVAASAYASKLPRWLMILAVLFLLQTLPWVLMGVAMGSASGGGAPPARLILYLLGWIPLVILIVLQAGAARIAPPAENHPTRIRVLALIALGWAVLMKTGARNATADVIRLTTFLILAPVCIYALCEPFRRIPSLYAPFARRGRFGRFLGAFLYPGWPSGVLFVFLVVSLYLALLTPDLLDDNLLGAIAAIGTITVPMAVLRLFFPRIRKILAFYALLTLLMILPGYVYGLASSARIADWSTTLGELLGCFPPSLLALLIFHAIDPIDISPFVAVCAGAVSALGILGLLAAADRKRGDIREMQRRALGDALPASETEPT